MDKFIQVTGARVHNLKNIDVTIPRNKLTVITGLSGSGKSSLAFDTIYAEGQRRYIETFSAYARQFLGNLERPDVDKITGLSPVISIEQKTTNRNPRSTVGTITEIYDFLRLLYARAGTAYSYITEEKMVKYTTEQIIDLIFEEYKDKKLIILSPVVKSRKGHYRELFVTIRKKGFLQARINGKISELTPGLKLDRYKTHEIEIVIDKLKVDEKNRKRLKESVKTALHHGKGVLMTSEYGTNNIRYFSKNLMCPSTGLSYDEPAPNSFSFNSPQGACSHCKGLGHVNKIDINKIIPDDSISIKRGGIKPIGEYQNTLIFWQIEAILKKYKAEIKTPIKNIPEKALQKILGGTEETLRIENSTLGISSKIELSFDGIYYYLERHANGTNANSRKIKNNYFSEELCPVCKGKKLKKESLWFRFAEKNISELAETDINELYKFFVNINSKLSDKQNIIAKEIIKELLTRLHFLLDVGLGYLNLNRSSRSLSGGESQRIRLASQIGSKLVNVLYILDEPSIGLHQRDNHRLINSLKQLRDTGNSVIVVEHDKDMMLASDYLIDMGPFAGRHGGEISAAGTPGEVLKSNTLTAQYLNNKKEIPIPEKRRNGKKEEIRLKGASGNNLKNINAEFPLGKFICVTGVSGSGKSTLVNDTLHPILSKHFYRSLKTPLPYKSIAGIEHIDKVIEVNQSPIGRTPRSNPATYTKLFDEIRKLYAQLPESKIRAYKLGRFSFNVKGGRCETCQGAGLRTIEMNFLPDVYIHCEDCQGKRYNRETLEVRYKGKSISDVLGMTINTAFEFFEKIPKIRKTLKALKDVGLGYITLGQSSVTISGGEAQRVKLATELAKRDTGKTLYILDEPTTGLHFEDIKMLLNVLNRLVDKGNTVIVIEHNMDVIKVADYIIDIGKEGGIKGGEIIAKGTPEEIIKNKNSYTAKFLKNELIK
ncbi:MAG: excinuclease ABC subunit UvrA [Bacteroidales bacterium]|nr:excinuclease ABC subunit UvrA [Bacteroidales bacterium]